MFETLGLSMFPAILPGARIATRPAGADGVRPGDVVCFLDESGHPTAHRLHRVERGPDGLTYVARSDLFPGEDRIPEPALTGIVEHVEWRGISYRTDGPLGRAFARLALSPSLIARAARFVLRNGIRALDFPPA